MLCLCIGYRTQQLCLVGVSREPAIFSVYVPEELAPDIQKAVENGRQVQDLMKESWAALRIRPEEGEARETAVR